MTPGHLGERLHDLLDNRLSSEAAGEAMRHLDECEECSAKWLDLRAAREALNSSQAGIDLRFASQLLDRDRIAEMAKCEDPRLAKAARPRDRRPVALSLSLSLILVAVVGAAYVAGQPEAVSPGLSASADDGAALSVASYDSESMRSEQEFSEWLHPDWQVGGLTPVEASEVRTESGSTMLVATVLVGDEPMLVTEQHGDLPVSSLAHLPVETIEGVDIYVIGTSPSQLVWQAGDVVVSLTCECALSTLREVAIAFPTVDERGFVDQVMTGLGVFADALTGK